MSKAREKRVKVDTAEHGEKFYPRHRRFKHVCCDCHLTHTVDMGIEDGWIWMRWYVDERGTAQRRKPFKFENNDD